jgi:hypothetical protein
LRPQAAELGLHFALRLVLHIPPMVLQLCGVHAQQRLPSGPP